MKGMGKVKEKNKIPYDMAVRAISAGVHPPPGYHAVKPQTSYPSQDSAEGGKKVDSKVAEKALLESLQRAKAKQLAINQEFAGSVSHSPKLERRDFSDVNSSGHFPDNGSHPSNQKEDYVPRKREYDDVDNRNKPGVPASSSSASMSSTAHQSKVPKASSPADHHSEPYEQAKAVNVSVEEKSVPAATNPPINEKVFAKKAQQILKKAILALGPAHATVENQCSHMLCVITFNKADILLKNYHRLYIVDPGQTMRVEALPDPAGLFVAVVYKVDNGYFYYKRWLCSTEAEMAVRSAVSVYEMDVVGGKHYDFAQNSLSYT